MTNCKKKYLQYDCYTCFCCCCFYSCRAYSCRHSSVDCRNNRMHNLKITMTCRGSSCFEFYALQQITLGIKVISEVRGIPTSHIWYHCSHVYTSIRSLLSRGPGTPKQSWGCKIEGLENKQRGISSMSTTTANSIKKKKRGRLFPARGAGTGSAGAARRVSVVTLFTTFTVVPGGVVLTVLKVGEIKDTLYDNTLQFVPKTLQALQMKYWANANGNQEKQG